MLQAGLVDSILGLQGIGILLVFGLGYQEIRPTAEFLMLVEKISCEVTRDPLFMLSDALPGKLLAVDGHILALPEFLQFQKVLFITA